MRILVLNNRIYRAFPELDRYSDERCRKFMRSAQRAPVSRAIRAVIVFLVAAAVLGGGIYLAALAVEAWFGGMGTSRAAVAETCLFLIPVALTPLAGFIARDMLLRRRIRWVLRTRGVCATCRYSLIGLPVSTSNVVVCPECSSEAEVDPSLGELVVDDAGMGRFQPSPAALPRPPRIFTPPRVRFLKRAAIITALVLGIGIPALFGAYELWLRNQAAAARADKPGAAALNALTQAIQPPGSEGGPNAIEVLEDALARAGKADVLDEFQNPPPENAWVHADFSMIFIPRAPDGDPAWELQNALNEAAARRLLEAYRQAGVYDAFDRMAACPRAARTYFESPDQPAFAWTGQEQMGMRRAALVNAARSWLAQQNSDLPEYLSATEANLAFARIARFQPTVEDAFAAVSIEMLTYERLFALLPSHPPAAWLDAVDAAIARQSGSPPPGALLEGARLMNLDTIAWIFADPDRVRWGRVSLELQSMLFAEYDGPLGTYAAHRDELNRIYSDAAARAAQPRWLRGPSPATGPGLVDALSSDPSLVLRSLDVATLTRRGYTICSALERYRIANGDYPESLADLQPELLSEAPVDPWTGKPFGYRRLSPPGPDGDPRGFILYSFGDDSRDDGGVRNTSSWGGNFAALREAGEGSDFIINDWTPPAQPDR